MLANVVCDETGCLPEVEEDDAPGREGGRGQIGSYVHLTWEGGREGGREGQIGRFHLTSRLKTHYDREAVDGGREGELRLLVGGDVQRKAGLSAVCLPEAFVPVFLR